MRREYKNAILQFTDAGGVIERGRLVLVDIARLAGSTPSSVGESPLRNEVVLNAAETSSNLYGVLKGKTLYSALHGVYAEVLQDLKCVFKDSTPSGQTTTQGREPEKIKFREHRRRKRNPSVKLPKSPRRCPPLTSRTLGYVLSRTWQQGTTSHP
jgi:hypothetical protein